MRMLQIWIFIPLTICATLVLNTTGGRFKFLTIGKDSSRARSFYSNPPLALILSKGDASHGTNHQEQTATPTNDSHSTTSRTNHSKKPTQLLQYAGRLSQHSERLVGDDAYKVLPSPDMMKEYGVPVASKCKPRLCRKADNVIWYQVENKAGLGDRLASLVTLGNLAGALCAKLYFKSPPCKMLSHVLVDCKMTWQDIVNLTYAYGAIHGSSPLLRNPPVEAGLYEVDIHGNSLAEFERAVAALEAGRKFRWRISQNVFLWRVNFAQLLYPKKQADATNTAKPYLLRQFPYGCQYLNFQYPQRLYDVASQFLRDNSMMKYRFITLHLRRGDSKSECNTTLERMRFYFDCWTKESNIANQRVYLFTDERNPKYLNRLQKLAKSYAVTLRIDMEAKLEAYFPVGWKQGVFQTSEIIRKSARLRFEVRRGIRCNETACSPVG